MTRAANDPRDIRDLAVLALREDKGLSPQQIARRLKLSPDVVETILTEDAAAYPDEPLRLRRRA